MCDGSTGIQQQKSVHVSLQHDDHYAQPGRRGQLQRGGSVRCRAGGRRPAAERHAAVQRERRSSRRRGRRRHPHCPWQRPDAVRRPARGPAAAGAQSSAPHRPRFYYGRLPCSCPRTVLRWRQALGLPMLQAWDVAWADEHGHMRRLAFEAGLPARAFIAKQTQRWAAAAAAPDAPQQPLAQAAFAGLA
jgi:hypothetical protein